MTPTPPPVAALGNVTHQFGTTTALDHVDFVLSPGEVVALLGPNGAGKTTFVRILLGLTRPTHGTARLYGLSPTDPRSRRRVGAMLQVARVPETLTVREHVHLFSSYYGTPATVTDTLAEAGVTAFADTRFGRLSGGQRQRALFALAICGRPDVLILDEPTVGLDIDARRGFWSGVRTRIADGCAVLLTTHYLEEADAVASRIVILHQGRVVTNGTPQAIKRRVGLKRVSCTTALEPPLVRAIAGVRDLTHEGRSISLLTEHPERVVGEILARDPSLTDLEVTGVRLDDAFLALTNAADRTFGGSHVETIRA